MRQSAGGVDHTLVSVFREAAREVALSSRARSRGRGRQLAVRRRYLRSDRYESIEDTIVQ